MSENYGFELVFEKNIPELNTTARLYRHVQTRAQLLSMENDDENKVFGITFRTPPEDSTGVPHIMEHAVFCGSRKYPVKEPFVELVKGSLKTFVNAMTFADKTCYPVASQNLQDFYNLIDVYMDAVFYPLIPPHTLAQEGWHYELDALDGDINFKGVVFNEMKGAYASPEGLMGTLIEQSIFPDNPYGFDAGGDPRRIPDLTYQQFKDFHARFYHPSNSYIFFYGDDPAAERLRRMDEYLRDFNYQPVDSGVALQVKFSTPRQFNFPYDGGEETSGKKGMLAVNWLLPETLDPELSLGLGMLTYILIGTPASPLRKALIDSGLGEDLAGVGLQSSLRQMYFSTGMKGVADGSRAEHPADFDRVSELIFATLAKLASEGIDPQTIAAALNTTEFRLRENNTGSFPRGLSLMFRALTSWLYDGDPTTPLAFEAPLEMIKSRLAGGEAYFENLIRSHLLDNPHRTSVILKPESGLSQRQELEEKARLAEIQASLSQEQLGQILEETRQLKLHQESVDTPEALATIPSLTLADLEKTNRQIPIDISQLGSTQALFHDLFTNGIVYLDLGLDLHLLPQEYLPYAALFGRVLLEMGTETEDFVRLSQRIGAATGGIHPVVNISTHLDSARAVAILFLRGKATLEHTPDLLAILRDVLLTARLDNAERFKQIVLEEKADLEAALVPAGHRIVNTRLRSFFSEAGWLDEQLRGISQLEFLRDLANKIDGEWPGILAALETMRSLLVNRNALLANITLDAAGWRQFQPELSAFLDGLPALPVAPVDWRRDTSDQDLGLTIPAQVNFVGKGANLFELGYQLDASYAVIANYLRTTWLWEKVRVQGGAYGAFGLFDLTTGVWTFLSYRDPNLLRTIEIYDRAGDFLSQLDSGRLSQDELVKTITGVIGEMDAYQLPDAKGYSSMVRRLIGDTEANRQKRREQVLSTRLEDFHAFGEILKGVARNGRVVVLGSEEAIQAANQQQPNYLAVRKVL